MDNKQSVPSLMPMGSDTCTHNVVRGSPSIDLREPKFCGRCILSLQDCNMPGQTLENYT